MVNPIHGWVLSPTVGEAPRAEARSLPLPLLGGVPLASAYLFGVWRHASL